MGRPHKIHKKKSFMFTTKHQSFTGWTGAVVGFITLVADVMMIMEAYNKAGSADINSGTIGLLSGVLNIIGVIFGTMGVKERDAHITVPIIAIVLNGILILFWTIILLIS